MRLRDIREYEHQQLDEISKAEGSVVGSIMGIFAGSGVGAVAGGAAGLAFGGPVGAAAGTIVGKIAGAITGYLQGQKIGKKLARGDEVDIQKWEFALNELKRAQKVAVREFEKHFMTKERKSAQTIRDLHKLNMKFVVPIEKLQKDIKRAKK